MKAITVPGTMASMLSILDSQFGNEGEKNYRASEEVRVVTVASKPLKNSTVVKFLVQSTKDYQLVGAAQATLTEDGKNYDYTRLVCTNAIYDPSGLGFSLVGFSEEDLEGWDHFEVEPLAIL
jgi:hypothetical protein